MVDYLTPPSYSKYDKDNKLITTVQQCLLSLGQPNVMAAASTALVALIKKDRSTVSDRGESRSLAAASRVGRVEQGKVSQEGESRHSVEP